MSDIFPEDYDDQEERDSLADNGGGKACTLCLRGRQKMIKHALMTSFQEVTETYGRAREELHIRLPIL